LKLNLIITLVVFEVKFGVSDKSSQVLSLFL